MSDLGDLRIGVKSDGSEDQLAAAIANSIERAFTKLGPRLAREFGNAFSRAAKQSSQFDSAFDGINREAARLNDTLRSLSDRLEDLARAGAAQRKAFGQGFDPDQLDAMESSLKEIISLQDEIKKSGGDPGLEAEFRQRTNLIRSELTATRTAAQQSTLAFREAANSRQRLETQASRERAAIIRSENGRAVAELQTRASRETAVIRSNAQQAVAITQAAAKRRAATFALVATAVRASERTIRSAFDGTARVVSSAFSSMRRAAQTTTTNIRQTFSSTNQAIRNDFSNSNSAITNSYSRSFKRNTSIVNNELGTQEKRIQQFSREATEEISSIGLGRIAGFGLLGVAAGRALSAGFTRAATLETAELALTQLLGTAEEAKALLDEVTEVVTGTPFALDQFAQATSRLIAYNVEAEKIPDVLRAVGDAAALAGPESAQAFDSILRSIGQINTVGRANLEEIKVIAEAGVPAFKILGNQLGVTTEELRDLFEKGAVPAGVAIDALIDGITNGTEGVNGATAAFGGLAKSLGGTLAGSVANFRTAIARLGAGVITAFKEPFVAALGAATAGVDLLGAALKSLATAFANSAAFRLVGQGLETLADAAKAAKTALVPFFDFISGGIVLLSQLGASLFVFRRLPAVLSAVGTAARVLLSPMNLLITAGVLVASFFKQAYDDSLDLRLALSELADVFKRIGRVAFDLARDAFGALADLFGGEDGVGAGVTSFASKIADVLVPALETLANFLKRNVLFPLANFANVVRTEVLPALGGFLTRAVERAKEAFSALVEFVRNEVIPVIGPILKRAVEIGRAAFEDIYDFLSGTLVPFIKSNLIPVLAGLGAAVGTLALTGGNLPLAGLVGVGAGIGAALANDDTRNKVFSFFEDLVDGIRERIGSIFEGDSLRRIGVGVLKVAERIGRTLGDALSGRRLITIVAAAAAAAAAVAAAFVVGFGRGVIQNLPDLIDLLTDGLSAAFQAAFEAIASDPRVAVAVVGAILGAAAITKLALAGRQAGRVLAQAMTEGAVTAGGVGAGGGARGLLTGLFGGPAAVRQQANQVGQLAGRQLVTAIRNEARAIDLLGGQRQSNLQLGRVPGESFVDQNRRLSGQLQELRTESGRLAGELGKAGAAGVRLGDGLKLITKGQIRQGFQQIGTAVRNAGKEIGTTAGILAGGAFAASFVSKALFDVNASGRDKLQAALGTIAIGAGVGGELGGLKGAAIGAGFGAALSAVGLLTTRVDENAEALKRAEEAAKGYADALRNLSDGGSLREAFRGVFENNLRENEDVLETLDEIGFKYEQIEAVLTRDISGGTVISGVRNQLREAGIEGDQFNTTLSFLEDQLRGFRIATQGENSVQSIFAETSVEANLAKGAIDVANTATQAFRNRVEELNEARIDGFRSRVDEARSALDEAGNAADAAKEKLRQFLSGETTQNTLQEQINDNIIAVGNLASSVAGLDLSKLGAVGTAEFENKVAEVQSAAANILTDVKPTSPQAAAEALAPLKTAIEEAGLDEEVAFWLQAGIDNALTAFNSTEGGGLRLGLFNAETLQAELDTALSTTEAELKVALKADPLTIPLIAAEAKAAFDTAGADSAQGFAEGLDGSSAAKDAARRMAEDALAAAETALDTGSPSEEFAKIGRFSAAGYAQGLNESKARVFQVAFQLGTFSMQGFRAGINAGAAGVLAAARSVADRAAKAMEDALLIDSPSKVTYEIGSFFGDGFAEGITDAANPALLAAVRVANAALAPLQSAGRNAAQAIGRGFAEEGASFVGSVRGALDEALADAEFYANQFKVVGTSIASALFGQFGGNVGGRPGAVDLERAFLSILGNTGGFQAAIKKQTDEFGFGGLTFDRNFAVGRENRQSFLEAGQNIRDYAQTLIDGGRSAQSAVNEAKVYRDQLLAVAKATGQPVAIFEEMIRQLGLADDQLIKFVSDVEKTTKAVRASTEAERRRLQAESQAERDREAAEKRAEEEAERARQRERDLEEANRTASITAPVFRDLVVQTPTGDPEGVALFVANRVAFAVRR